MGYKLAGFDVIGGVEIDEKMMSMYRKNHSPAHSYLMSIVDFNKIPDNQLPSELFHLDILDGSPPCSSFSMAGEREDKWGVKKKFREGQSEQVLDDLFFHFIETAKKLKPKVVVAENVKGLISGKAKGYVKKIFNDLSEAGYDCQLFLLNSAFMGVPQSRERTFFIAKKKSMYFLDGIKLNFDEVPIAVKDCSADINTIGKSIGSGKMLNYWKRTPPGNGFGYAGGFNSHKKIGKNHPSPTITSSVTHSHWDKPNYISDSLIIRLQTFPDDYDFCTNEVNYVCGMSVPPMMTKKIAEQIFRQWLK